MTSMNYRNDGRVVDVEHVLNGHSWNLCNEDPSEGIGYCGVNANHIKLHVQIIFLLYFDSKTLHPISKVPCIAYAECHVHIC